MFPPCALGSVVAVDDETAPQPARFRRFLRDVLVVVLAAILISFLLKTFVVRSFYIPSPSMSHTLEVDDRIIVNELVPRLIPISRGDVVVFSDPGSWLPSTPDTRGTVQRVVEGALSVVGLAAPDSDDHLVKRVIGLPGDHVTCCGADGRVTVDGVPIDEPYLTLPVGETDAVPATDAFDVTVPEGQLWVLGDNRYDSADSAYRASHGLQGGGFVPIDDVVGRAVVVTWPIAHWSWLDDYPAVFREVDSGTG